MTMAVDVGALADFQDDAARVVEVDGRRIGIVRWRDRVYALHDVCPHQRGPVCEGALTPYLTSAVAGDVDVDEDVAVVVCPWHRWEYRVDTGVCVRNPRFRVRTYRAWVSDGRVLVDPRRPAGGEVGRCSG
jgi:nitrite reductase (NADH) small subunit